MSGEIAAARAHPAVVVSMIVAAVAVTTAALVAIAYMLGWMPGRSQLGTPVGIANPAQQASGVATDLALSPGESVVVPSEALPPSAAMPAAETPKPATPSYARPAPPAPKPALAPAKTALAKSAAKPPPPQPAPPKSSGPPHRYCVNCGNIAAITTYGRGEWDVRVRFEDGSQETLRYREPPPFRLGDRVRLEEGRLQRE